MSAPQACWPVFTQDGTRCGECDALWSATRVCPTKRATPTVPTNAATLPPHWHDRSITIDPITGCWLWTDTTLPPPVARKLIANRMGNPRSGRQECERDGCVSPLHAGRITPRGAGS